MNALMVKRSESGVYTVPGSATTEDWDEVQANADSVEFIESWSGWDNYITAYAVQINGKVLIYFVENMRHD